MKKHVSDMVRSLLSLCVFLCNSFNSSATHLVAADLTYKWVSGNTYQVTIVLYGDCGAASALAFSGLPISSPQVCIYNADNYVKTINLIIQNPVCGVEITPVICPGTVTQCTDPASTVPGIKQFNYTATVTLPGASHYWRFIYNGFGGDSTQELTCPGTTGFTLPPTAGRGATITNIQDAGNSIMQLIDTLDNTYHHNSNPELTVLPAAYYCQNTNNCYGPGAVDRYDSTALSPKGDSLVFSLVPATIGQTNCGSIGGKVSYTGVAWIYPTAQPVTGATPLQVDSADQFSFDSSTGQICFFPNLEQRSDVVYNIREFRNDTFIGSCQREMTFLVQECISSSISAVYSGVTGGTIIDSADFQVCPGIGDFSMYMSPSDDDPKANITVTNGALPPGATFTTAANNTPNPQCTFTWTADGTAPGTYTYTVTFTDDHCPYADKLFRTFHIIETAPVVITPTVKNDICKTTNGSIGIVTDSVTAPYSYQWSNDSTGTEIKGLAAGGYSVTVTDKYGCKDSLSINVGEDICPELAIHDVITPDGDGINDVWVIEGIQNYPKNKVQIFDKWGNLLYEQQVYNNDWGGRGSKGELLPSGTYYYLIKLNAPNAAGGQSVYKGALLIKR